MWRKSMGSHRYRFRCYSTDIGSRVIQRKERQFRIGIRQQIEIVTEIPAFTGGIPTDRAIWLGEVSITVAVEIAILPAVTGMVGAETAPFSFGFLTFFLTGGLQWGEKLGVA